MTRALPWDDRMKVGEHEAFFYALHLNKQRVVSCPDVTVTHVASPSRPHEYVEGSLRYKVVDYYQFFCKDFPYVRRFSSPFYTLDCETRGVRA